MARLRSGTAALFLCALLAPSLAAEQKPLATSGNKNYHHGNPLSEGFGRYVTDLMEEWKAPGLSVAVLDGDQVYMQGYGFAKLPDTPVTPETLFLGGSTTKAHVAATVAQLIAKGDHADVFRLGWSTPISSIIRDDFVMYDEWSTVHLTLEDAVSHRTGLPRHGMSWAGTADPKDVRNRHRTNQDTVRNLRHLAPTAEPRTRFQYCNLMYIVLSHVIETVTKSWVGDVLREAIWQPLGMTSTFLSYHDARKSGNVVATGYWWDHEAQEYVAVEEDPVQFSSGAGAIITNAVDYAKWVKCLVYEAAPFSRATHEDIRRPRMLEIPVPAAGFDVSNYGLGWERTTLHGQAVYKHNGGTQHFGTNVLWMPDVKFGVVAFANTATVSNVIEELLTLRLAEDRLGIPQSERRDYSVEKRKELDQVGRDFANATNILYPNRDTHSSPSPIDYRLLAGTYNHPGYGTYSFQEEEGSLSPGSGKKGEAVERQLVATRDDTITSIRLVLRHVVGDYWVAYAIPITASPLTRGFYAAKFIMGVDGKAGGLEIEWEKARSGIAGVRVRFERAD